MLSQAFFVISISTLLSDKIININNLIITKYYKVV